MECPICFDFLSLARQLNCSHCFCEECLNKICVSGEFKCPICRKKHRNVIVKNLNKRWFNPKNYSKTERKLKYSDEFNQGEEGKNHLNFGDNAMVSGEVGNGEGRNLQGVRVINEGENEEKKFLFKFFFGLFWFLIIILVAFVRNI